MEAVFECDKGEMRVNRLFNKYAPVHSCNPTTQKDLELQAVSVKSAVVQPPENERLFAVFQMHELRSDELFHG